MNSLLVYGRCKPIKNVLKKQNASFEGHNKSSRNKFEREREKKAVKIYRY